MGREYIWGTWPASSTKLPSIVVSCVIPGSRYTCRHQLAHTLFLFIQPSFRVILLSGISSVGILHCTLIILILQYGEAIRNAVGSVIEQH